MLRVNTFSDHLSRDSILSIITTILGKSITSIYLMGDMAWFS